MEMNLAIEEISRRDASNEEDRVLSILKLLGVEGAVQVRMKKTLMQQVLHLGQSLVEKQMQELLVRLCLVDGYGNEWQGMSWAPTFDVQKGSRQEGIRKLADLAIGWDYFERFTTGARVVMVNDRCGYLTVECEVVLRAELIDWKHNMISEAVQQPQQAPKSIKKETAKREMALRVAGKVVLNLMAQCSEEVHDVCFVEPVPRYNSQGLGSVVWTGPGLHEKLSELLPEIPVWLVRMGFAYPVGRRLSEPFTFFLVCIASSTTQSLASTQHLQLHKVGYFGLSSSCVPAAAAAVDVDIGGFGSGLSSYVLDVRVLDNDDISAGLCPCSCISLLEFCPCCTIT